MIRGGIGISSGMRQMALGAFYFSLMSLGVKLVGQRIPNQEMVLVRGVLTLGFTYLLLRRAKVPVLGNRRRGLITRGFLGFAALSCFYYAVVHLPLAEATVLQYTNPLWAALLASWYLTEPIGRKEIAVLLIGLAGVFVIARPSFVFGESLAGLDSVAVGAALLGAAFSGAAYVGVRELSRTEHPLVIVFYFPLVTVPAALPGALVNFVWPTSTEWILLLGIGIAAQLGQVAITRGLQQEPAGRATAIGYLQVVFAGVWGVAFFSDRPDLWTVMGASMILVCTLALALQRGRPAPAAAVEAEIPR